MTAQDHGACSDVRVYTTASLCNTFVYTSRQNPSPVVCEDVSGDREDVALQEKQVTAEQPLKKRPWN